MSPGPEGRTPQASPAAPVAGTARPRPATSVRPAPSSAPAAVPPPAQSPPDPGPNAVPAPGVSLGTSFRLPEGASATVTGEGLTITFARLITDSRCPLDAQCIWAGEVKIAVTADQAGAPVTLELGDAQPQGTYRGYSIHLVSVDPYPALGTGDRPRSAVLRVTRP